MTATCGVCQDKGIVKVNWEDAPSDFAVCLCSAGLSMRVDRNATAPVAPLWWVWCAREQVDRSRVFMLEDVLTPEELTAAGLGPLWEPSPESREEALLRAGKTQTRKPKL